MQSNGGFFLLLEMRIQSDKKNITHSNSQQKDLVDPLGVANVY